MENTPSAPPPSLPRRKRLHKYDVEARLSLVKENVIAADSATLDTPSRVAELVRGLIGQKPKEHFIMVALNARSRPIGMVTVSIGTLSASLVHPREVFAPALLLNAAAVIVAHNHPSGDITPSPEDRVTTRRLVDAGRILGVPVLDHVIVGAGNTGYTSFKDGGLI